jgi:hypothetical protein
MTIDEFIPRRHQEQGSGETPDQPLPNLDSLIQRVAGASITDIDEVIIELNRVRDALHRQGERLSADISRYASLNQAVMTATKIIGENLKQRNLGAPVNREQALADFKAKWLGRN